MSVKAKTKADDAGRAIITLGKKQKNGIVRPVLHVLMPDGRVTEFKSRAIVIPEDGDGDDGIVAVLMNTKGELFHTPDGEPVVLAVPGHRPGRAPRP